MFEHRSEPIIPRPAFILRIIVSAALALSIILASLAIGIIGYHALEGQPWIDALVNASMILGGMGPVDQIHTNEGKLFASFYALYSGIIFLVAAGVLIAPIVHRFAHHFHLEGKSIESDDKE